MANQLIQRIIGQVRSCQFFHKCSKRLYSNNFVTMQENKIFCISSNLAFVKIALAICELTNTLGKAIDNNLYTCGVLWDFSKAFDTVNHEILL